MIKVITKSNIELSIGDKLLIVSDKLGNKMLANVDKGEVITISSFSDNGKILYHNGVLALPVDSDVFVKL
jgi:hypothetical protein